MLIRSANGDDAAATVLGGIAAARLPTLNDSISSAPADPMLAAEREALASLRAMPPLPTSPPRPWMPPGSLVAWSQRQRRMRVAVPAQFAPSGFGAAGASHREVQLLGDVDTSAATPSTDEAIDAAIGAKAWYRDWRVLAAIGGGLAILGLIVAASSARDRNYREREANGRRLTNAFAEREHAQADDDRDDDVIDADFEEVV